MEPVIIHVITEGATERETGKVLQKQGILGGAIPKPPEWKGLVSGREGYDQVIAKLKGAEGYLERLRNEPQLQRVLLLFDQEDRATPQQRATEIAEALRWDDPFWSNFEFQPIDGQDNLFEHRSDKLHIVLHISNASVDGITCRDFDGYILQLLQGAHKEEIARALVPSTQPQELLKKAEEEISRLMQRNGFPWTHAKSWLYAYITVFQFRQSHVRFAARVVEYAPEEELRRVFAPLIRAWEHLLGS